MEAETLNLLNLVMWNESKIRTKQKCPFCQGENPQCQLVSEHVENKSLTELLLGMKEVDLIRCSIESLSLEFPHEDEMLNIEDFIQRKIADIKEQSLSNDLNRPFVCSIRETLRQKLHFETEGLGRMVHGNGA